MPTSRSGNMRTFAVHIRSTERGLSVHKRYFIAENMAPSSTRNPELQRHMRKLGRILAQINQNALENELYEPIDEILHQVGRLVDSPEYDVSVHPQALFFVRREDGSGSY